MLQVKPCPPSGTEEGCGREEQGREEEEEEEERRQEAQGLGRAGQV
jgi:hypothetical protein